MSKIALTLIVFMLTGCSDIGAFTVEESFGEILVEGSANPINDVLPDNVLPPLAIDFDLESELEERDADGAQEVTLESLQLRVTDTAITEGDEDNFDFLESIEFTVESRREGSDLEKRTIGSLEMVPEGQTTIDIPVDNTVNLKPYVEEGMRLTTSGSGSVPPDDVSIIGDLVLEIEVF